VAFDEERRAHDRRVAAVRVLPDVMTEHDGRRRGPSIIRRREHATTERTDAERREVVAGDELGAQRPRRRINVLPPDAEAGACGLKGRDLFELGHFGFQPFEQRKRIQPPSLLRTALDAAGIAVTDTVKAQGIADRQRAQHHRMDQGENGRGPANAQGKRRDRGRCEHARHPELSQRVPQFADDCAQRPS
jgi:hypothetical protein